MRIEGVYNTFIPVNYIVTSTVGNHHRVFNCSTIKQVERILAKYENCVILSPTGKKTFGVDHGEM